MSNLIPQFYDGVSYTSALITPAKAGAHGLPSSLTKPYNKGFQPRVGLAWDVFGDGKTALRMGFGRYMSRTNVIEDINRMVGNPPWTKVVDSGWSGATDTLATCPTCRTMDAVGPNLKNQVQGVSNTSCFAAVDINFRPPESYQWNLTVSREVMKNTVLEASYIGNHGLHIWRRNVNWNDVPANQPCKGPLSTAPRSAAMAALKNDARFQIASRTRLGWIRARWLLLIAEYPAWVALRWLSPPEIPATTGCSFGSTAASLSGWPFKPLTPGRIIFRMFPSRPSPTPRPIHLITLSTRVTQTSTGGRRLSVTLCTPLPSFKNRGSAFSHILGDWQLNGIFSHYGSTPVDVLSGVNTYGTAGNVNPRPNLVQGVPIYLHTADKTQWLNPAAFSLPGVGQLGSLGKGSIRGKPINNVDFSIAKNWKFKERYGLQFRGEMFNVFNHANFGGYHNSLNFQGNSTLSNFGSVTNGSFGTLSTAQAPREIQFGLKFSF